jgi:hypothetical protein
MNKKALSITLALLVCVCQLACAMLKPSSEIRVAAVPSGTEVTSSEKSTISGAVEDAFQQPIMGALIQAVDSNSGEVHRAATDNDGQFMLPALCPGVYCVRIEAPGYLNAQMDNLRLMHCENARLTCIMAEIEPLIWQEDITPMINLRSTASGITVRIGQDGLLYPGPTP